MNLVDIGVNLVSDRFRADRDEVIARAFAAGVTQMVVTGTSETHSRKAQALAARYPDRLYATAGIHPHEARHWTEDTERNLAQLAAAPEIVAIGEAGLDFNRDFSPRPNQERAFERQLALAAALNLPIFLHERDAHPRFVSILSRHRHELKAAVVHCFTGNAEELAAYLDLDLHIGITGWICDEHRGLHLRDLVWRIPLERLMLETDAPYLLPKDLRPKPRHGRNEPAFLPHVLDTVAFHLDLPAETLAEATTRTARGFFGLHTRIPK